MKIVVDAGVFAEGVVGGLDLLQLLRLGYQGRYRVVTNPVYVPALPDSTHPVEMWLNSLPDPVRQECGLALEAGIEDEALHPSARSIRVSLSGEGRWSHMPVPVVSLSEALSFLEKPFRLLVENSRNDRAFLLTVAGQEDRNALEAMVNQGWIVFEHTGGTGEMKKRVEAASTDAKQTLKVWALFDRDALQPTQINPAIDSICQACGRQVPFHQLGRRAIENYLPLQVLGAWARGSAKAHKVAAFKALTRVQRDHYNMKSGFAGDSRRTDGLDAGELYSDLPVQIRSTLDSGFGTNLADLFHLEENRVGGWYAGDDQLRETVPLIKRLLSFL